MLISKHKNIYFGIWVTNVESSAQTSKKCQRANTRGIDKFVNKCTNSNAKS